MIESKVLILDIETSPLIVYVWELKDQYVGLNQMIQDWEIMAWSAKRLGEPASSIRYYDKRHNKDDKAILQPLWEMLNEADIVITQNGKAFDAKKINARFMLHKMPPPKPYKHLDTYLIAKNAAAFTSHSLEYLSERLNTKYKKLSHSKFPGLSLWKECLKGNKEAWEEMKKYNIHDVLSTEEFYLKIRAWAPASAPDVYSRLGECKTCGSRHLIKQGFDRTKTGIWQQLQCTKCHRWQRGDKVNK